jgi:hypothetical protein
MVILVTFHAANPLEGRLSSARYAPISGVENRVTPVMGHRHGKEASGSLLLLRVQSLLELFDTLLALPLLVWCRG